MSNVSTAQHVKKRIPPAVLITWATLALIAAASFALLYFGPARAQRCPDMESCWTGQFPHWGRPWTVPVWSVASTFDVLRYCFPPCGYLLAGFTFAGTVQLTPEFVALTVAPG